MSRERCPRCSKALDSDGSCRNCGKSYPAMVGTPMTRGEVKERVRQAQAVKSGSCRGQFHSRCHVSTCPCWCHDPNIRRATAAQLRREAAELEHRAVSRDAGVREDVARRAEELRRRADELS